LIYIIKKHSYPPRLKRIMKMTKNDNEVDEKQNITSKKEEMRKFKFRIYSKQAQSSLTTFSRT